MNFKIAEGGQLTPSEKIHKGICQTDEGNWTRKNKLMLLGYFGKGIYFTQFPSYGMQYCGEHECLLLSWILMGEGTEAPQHHWLVVLTCF